LRVALGILLSRLFGFLREATLAYFFGAGPHADVFRTALRGPNLLQNLLGEQTLSASFIPVYSRLLEQGRERTAGRFAGAMLGLLTAVAAAIALLGIVLAEPIVSLLAPGYLGDAAKVAAGTSAVDRFPLAVRAVRIIFPMTGMLVLSAWALGVLNSHRRFFVAYFAPVLWNSAIIAALWLAGGLSLPVLGGGKLAEIGGLSSDRILLAACFGALIGGGLQFLVQLPLVLRVLQGFRLRFSLRVEGVREALQAFAPLAAGRGAVQLSGYIDMLLASFLVAGALAALGYAQTLYLLPIGLFGMSVAAAELPELSRRMQPEQSEIVVQRLEQGTRQMAFLTVPTVVGYLALGYEIVGALFRRGSFGDADNWLVYLVLSAYSLGLLASNSSRLLNNLFFALGRTRIPARIAVERVSLSALTGASLMLWFDRYSIASVVGSTEGHGLFLGAVGLALGASVGAWFELWRLRRAVARLHAELRWPWGAMARMLVAALVAAAPSRLVVGWFPTRFNLVTAFLAVAGFALVYLVVARILRVSEVDAWLQHAGKRQQR
jgi:putative peptidoglycan lipid II flippase